jgi:hypothetical protein
MAEPSQERLDQLEDRIDAVRKDAEEDGLLPDSTPEPTFRDPDPDGPDRPARIGSDQNVP